MSDIYESATLTIGNIVAMDFRAATIFKDAGIDFCCGGNRTLGEMCIEKGISKNDLMRKLQDLEPTETPSGFRFNEWEPGFLIDYIINVHHSYVRKSLPDLTGFTAKIADVHGERHPELNEVADLVSTINNELPAHMKKEEEILFPAIKELYLSGSEKSSAIINGELSSFISEHELAGGAMDRINKITDSYKLPKDACNSYRMAFDLLSKFEDDLHVHVHLENNILFPKVLSRIN